MKTYKCTKAFSIPYYGGDGFPSGKDLIVKEGSIWSEPEDPDTNFIGGDVRLESESGSWIEITFDDFETHFQEAPQ